MKKFYFFESVAEKSSDGVCRLRALPGQTDASGNPIDCSLNVHAPKTRQTRLGYNMPGVLFCSDYLETVQTTGASFYTVYVNNDENLKPFFHVVKSPDGRYRTRVKDLTSTTEAAYQLYLKDMGLLAPPKASCKPVRGPASGDGKAREIAAAFDEAYDGQVENEAQAFIGWMLGIFREKNVRPSVAIRMTEEDKNLFARLLAGGESLDTLASRSRLEQHLTREGLIYEDFMLMSSSASHWYLSLLEYEHDSKADCTAVSRDITDPDDMTEAASLAASMYNRQHYDTAVTTPETTADIARAIGAGWTLQDIILPANLERESSTFWGSALASL